MMVRLAALGVWIHKENYTLIGAMLPASTGP